MKTMRSYNPHGATGTLLRFAASKLLTITLALAVSFATLHAGPPGIGGKRGVETMNANLYIGAGTERILALDPTDPGYVSNLVMAVTGVYYEILASQPPLRLAVVADGIVARQPGRGGGSHAPAQSVTR